MRLTTLVLLLSLTGVIKEKLPMPHFWQRLDYIADERLETIDNKIYFLVKDYDRNKDGLYDGKAIFEPHVIIRDFKDKFVYTSVFYKVPTILFIDDNYDGEYDSIFTDTDKDGYIDDINDLEEERTKKLKS